MPSSGIIFPKQLAMLRRVFHEHVRKFGIRGDEACNSVAHSLATHFNDGMRDATELASAIEREDRPAEPAEQAPVPGQQELQPRE